MRGLQRMIEEDKYCIDILTQVLRCEEGPGVRLARSAGGTPGALRVEAAQLAVPEADEKVREASAAIARLVRS